ncbi:hypothetical protein QLX08_001179 [Tetragonisca angustula]|uniref:Uncharacterized protein n=1 Tax=Tetragonisca angustula TaxID=166442 RepID=A0AAW1AFR4_9HYME
MDIYLYLLIVYTCETVCIFSYDFGTLLTAVRNEDVEENPYRITCVANVSLDVSAFFLFSPQDADNKERKRENNGNKKKKMSDTIAHDTVVGTQLRVLARNGGHFLLFVNRCWDTR